MSDSKNMSKLQAAYRAWNDSKGGSSQQWLDLMADEVCMKSVDDDSAGLEFAKNHHSKEEAVKYMVALLEDWQMIHWTPHTYVEEGDRIAVFARCSWNNRHTGRCTGDLDIAHLWRFAEGQIVELTEVFDSAKAAAASLPVEPAAEGAS